MTTAQRLTSKNGDFLTIAGQRQRSCRSRCGSCTVTPTTASRVYLGWGRELGEHHYKVAHGSPASTPTRCARQQQQWVHERRRRQPRPGSRRREQLPRSSDHAGARHDGRPRDRPRGDRRRETKAEDPKWAPKMSPLDKAARLKGKTSRRTSTTRSGTERGYDKGKDGADPEVRKSPYQWGMVFDLNACTGCSACVVACVAENNIPMVGKIQVARNREMFWIRADRYFSSSGERRSPGDGRGPAGRQHAGALHAVRERAVRVGLPGRGDDAQPGRASTTWSTTAASARATAATTAPTRSAASTTSTTSATRLKTKQMAFNPDVTVRHRGVMEKCTYCVQRINGGQASRPSCRARPGR